MEVELDLLLYFLVLVLVFAISMYIYTIRHKILIGKIEGVDLSKKNGLYTLVSRLFIKK